MKIFLFTNGIDAMYLCCTEEIYFFTFGVVSTVQ